jgi:hypothetical protein
MSNIDDSRLMFDPIMSDVGTFMVSKVGLARFSVADFGQRGK